MKYVYEVSDYNPAQGVVRIDSILDLNSFEYIQIFHVFEHFSSPREFIEDPVKSLLPGDFLYIEVPVEGHLKKLMQLKIEAQFEL